VVLCLVVSTGLCSSSGADLDSTAEMLKQLQDSGVMNSVKAELEKMMADKDMRGSLQDTILAKEKELRAKINQQLNELEDEEAKEGTDEMLTFAVSYASEKSLDLSKDLLKKISAIPVAGSEANKALHFVQLSTLMDQLAQSTKSVQKAVSAADFKTLADLKDYLNMPKATEGIKKASKTATREEKPAVPKKSESQAANAIRGFAAMAGNNPEMMVNMILMGMSNYELAAPETINMIRGYSKGLSKMEGFTTFVQYTAELLASTVESEEGEELMQILPLFMQEESREQGIDRLQESAQKHWGKFFGQLHNTDMKHKFLKQCGSALNAGYKYILQDESKMMFANVFLMTQGLPTVQPNNVVDSLLALLDKSLKVFTTVKFDMKPVRDSLQDFVKRLEKEYVKTSDFHKLDEDEQAELIARFLDESVILTAQEVFIAHDWVYSKGNYQCAESVICALNEHSLSQNPINSKVTHGLSMVLGWTWASLSDEEDFDVKLFAAAGHPSNKSVKEKKLCSERYPDPTYPEPSCRIFEWQPKGDTMSLDFEHDEL